MSGTRETGVTGKIGKKGMTCATGGTGRRLGRDESCSPPSLLLVAHFVLVPQFARGLATHA